MEEEKKKKKPIFKRWWFWFVVVIVIIAIASGGSNNESKQTATKVVEENKKKEIETIKISAVDLHDEYKENEVAADNKYKKQTLEITGTVQDIGKDITDEIYITLDTGEALENVQCFFDDSETESVGNIEKGKEITIIGKCDGAVLGSVMIKNSKIK